jgi:hypothetical protein
MHFAQSLGSAPSLTPPSIDASPPTTTSQTPKLTEGPSTASMYSLNYFYYIFCVTLMWVTESAPPAKKKQKGTAKWNDTLLVAAA